MTEIARLLEQLRRAESRGDRAAAIMLAHPHRQARYRGPCQGASGMTAHHHAHARPSHVAARSARIRWYAGLAVEVAVLVFFVAAVLIAMSVL